MAKNIVICSDGTGNSAVKGVFQVYFGDTTPNLKIHVMPPEYHPVQSAPVLARGLHGVSGS